MAARSSRRLFLFGGINCLLAPLQRQVHARWSCREAISIRRPNHWRRLAHVTLIPPDRKSRDGLTTAPTIWHSKFCCGLHPGVKVGLGRELLEKQ